MLAKKLRENYQLKHAEKVTISTRGYLSGMIPLCSFSRENSCTWRKKDRLSTISETELTDYIDVLMSKVSYNIELHVFYE